MSHLRCALFAILLAGCLSPSAEPTTGEAVAAAKDSRCMPNVCGTRSAALLECTYFWELNSDGAPNDNGVHIVAVHRADGTAMHLIARADQLIGVDPTTGATLAEHHGLEGTVIVTMVGSETRVITIDRVAPLGDHFWVGGQPPVETYDLRYTSPSGAGAPLQVVAIAFGGDVYDPVNKLVSVGPAAAGWINFACKGSTLYRQHLLGYTEAAQTRLGITTTPVERQATLNALAMNACGTGRTWTTDVEPITLSESHHMIVASSPYQLAPATYEAIWTQDGAVCVNIPRLATSVPMVSDTLAAMADECGAPIPACTSAMLASWWLYGDVVTGNPPGSTP